MSHLSGKKVVGPKLLDNVPCESLRITFIGRKFPRVESSMGTNFNEKDKNNKIKNENKY